MQERLVVGTRASALALWQTEHVAKQLRAHLPGLQVAVRRIETRGDRVRDRALSLVGGKGLFVKEIEEALLAGEVDLAVHSLKDMPSEQPAGLMLAAILERADARDALVSRQGTGDLAALPPGARVGTSSQRRRAQILAVRPDLQVLDLRGNVDTRLRKLYQGDYEAIILAVAGLARLGHDDALDQALPPEVMLPAVGQGALCVEARADDAGTRARLAFLDHGPTRQATTAERAFLRRLEGGCQVPIGAYGQIEGDRLWLRGLVASPDGRHVLRDEVSGAAAQAERLGLSLAETLLAAGAGRILAAVREAV